MIGSQTINTKNIQSDSCSVKLSPESVLVKEVKHFENTDTKSSSMKSENKITLLSSNSVVDIPTVSLKIVDEN